MQPQNQVQNITVHVADLASSNGANVVSVLHVDDDSAMLSVSKRILMMQGNFEIDHAGCVDEAFEKLSTRTYDVIVSDYNMPQKNGLEFLKELREQKNQIPFILFTGAGGEEVAIKALNFGANGYYDKQGLPQTVYGELAHGIMNAAHHESAEAALVKAQALADSVFNSTNDMIWSVGADADDFHLLTFNKAMSDYFLRTQNLRVKPGMKLNEVLPSEQLVEKWRHLYIRALTEGSYTIEYKTSKEPRVLELTFNVLNRGEEKFGISVFGKDITERKKMEEALLSAEEKFRTIFENVHDVVTYVDTHGKILDVNDRVEELVGYKREEVIGKNFVRLGFISFSDIPKLIKLFFSTIKSGEAVKIVELQFNHKNGGKVSVEVGTRFIREKNGKIVGVVNIFRDISERKKAEKALMQSEQRFREFADSLPEIVYETDETGRPTFVNRRASEILGYSIDEIKQTNFVEFLAPRDRQRAMKNVQSIMQGEKLKGSEYTLQRKNGTALPAVVFSEPTTTATGAHGLRGIIVNMYEAKKAADSLALVNEKLNVVGSLTRHDVRNKLSAINGYSYILKKKYADKPDVVDGLSKIEQAVRETDRIFDFAKMYEEIGAQEQVYVDVEKTLNEAVALFSDPLPKVINKCGGLTVLADSFLRQLFYNLVDNTRKYGEKTTKISAYYVYEDNDHLKLFYEDDGVGISPKNKSHLFKEGFSTGRSTGYGLFLIKKMIEVYGWTIEETGEVRKGARFQITIPKYSHSGKENYLLDKKKP